MGIADDKIDRFRVLADARVPWDMHWSDIAKYSLPDVDPYNSMFGSGWGGISAAIDSVASAPVAATASRNIYDQTSLMAIERCTAGILALKTPQNDRWHGVKGSDPFGGTPSLEEKSFYERYRNYLHAMRNNVHTGFWVNHNTSVRSTVGLGTGVMWVGEAPSGDPAAPLEYCYSPLTENFMSTNFVGVVDTNYRHFRRSARNCVEKWGDNCSPQVRGWAADNKTADRMVDLLHATEPRFDAQARSSYKIGGDVRRSNVVDLPGVRGSAFASYYIEIKNRHFIGESGYFSFPWRVTHWSKKAHGPYSEGPLAIALADIKSLNLLAKNALMAASQAVNPPVAYVDDVVERLDLNAGGRNPGLVNDQGMLLVKPLVTSPRPDFAAETMKLKQAQIGDSLYLPFWQTLIKNLDMPVANALLLAAEKGEMLGPVGLSLDFGFGHQFDRETDILERMGAFRPGSPLEAPKSLQGRSIGLVSSSPLDRLQRSQEFIGMRQVIDLAAALLPIRPDVAARLDVDEILDIAQEIVGAPLKTLVPRAEADYVRELQNKLQQAMQAAHVAQQAGEAASAVATGANDLSQSTAAGTAIQMFAKANPNLNTGLRRQAA